ncbi:MAG: glycerol-3-phosphate 1-O-acyltransferase PlsY [Pseudomonadota bacterium]|nr:glycerol-3-phosphate 1-O-acyltransferase PlsY [Pseudomonadota bacterium]
MLTYLLPPLAYLFGSISSAIIVSRLMGLPDPRSTGSKNPGATNVLRIGNKKAAAITLLGDVLKGLIPVLIARLITTNPVVLSLVGLAALLGHLFPLFFGFKGGKGVATAIGVIAGLSPPLALTLILTWLVMALLFRYSSLAALTAAVLAPLYSLWLLPGRPYLLFTLALAALLLWRHRENIRRLLDGTEKKIGYSEDVKSEE